MAGRKRKLRQALPISDRRVAPPPRLQHLPIQIRADRREPLCVDIVAEPGPSAPVGFDFRDSAIVVHDERAPQAPAAARAIRPRDMVEPQQIFVRYALQVGEATRDRRRILRGCLASRLRPVEADPARIRLVIITGIPARLAEAARPRRGAVVMIVLELMREAERSSCRACLNCPGQI